MTTVNLKGNPIKISGNLPALKTQAKDFTLVGSDLQNVTLANFKGRKKLLSIVPSLDTGVCSKMTKHFNEMAAKNPNVIFITVSADLPFAQKRFCQVENVQNVLTLSMMRNDDFGKAYGVLLIDGPLAGVLTRAVLILDEKDHVIYSELVPEIGQEPDYNSLSNFL